MLRLCVNLFFVAALNLLKTLAIRVRCKDQKTNQKLYLIVRVVVFQHTQLCTKQAVDDLFRTEIIGSETTYCFPISYSLLSSQ